MVEREKTYRRGQWSGFQAWFKSWDQPGKRSPYEMKLKVCLCWRHRRARGRCQVKSGQVGEKVERGRRTAAVVVHGAATKHPDEMMRITVAHGKGRMVGGDVTSGFPPKTHPPTSRCAPSCQERAGLSTLMGRPVASKLLPACACGRAGTWRARERERMQRCSLKEEVALAARG